MSRDPETPLGMVAGRYRLEAELGHGGTATVYQAWDTRLQVGRAVKVLTVTSRRLRAELQRRLEREAQTMATLDNPHLLKVYDIGEEDGRDYIVMELAEGGSLNDWLDAHGAMAPATAVAFVLHLLSALEAAHSAGIVHRDVKPQNILVNAQGCALLADFGIALWDREDIARHTQAGTLMGSLAFMAPEQRQDASAVGPAADIYATGATLYALLTESLPLDLFLAPPHSTRWSRVLPLLQPIIARATLPAPEERYPSAHAMGRALAAVLPLLGTDQGDTGLRPSPSATAAVLRHLSESTDDEASPLILRPLLLPSGEPPTPTPSPSPSPSAALEGYTPTLPGGGGPPLQGARPTLVASDDLDERPIPPGTQPTVAVPTFTPLATPSQPPWWVLALALAFLLPILGAGLALNLSAPPPPSAPLQASLQPLSLVLPTPRAVDVSAALDIAASIQLPPPPSLSVAVVTATPEAASGKGAVSGRWSGVFGGRAAQMTLRGGAGALSGSVTVSFGDRAQAQQVRGRYDDATRTLHLEDIDDTSPSAGVYTAILSEDGTVLTGTLERRAGGAQSQTRIMMRRSP